MFLGAEMTKVSQRVQRRLKDLAADHAAVCGSEFSHFYCPIVYRDDETDLCEAHIINQAFGVSNLWTVQRKDVDNFFGSMFESEFIALAHRPKDLFDAISDPEKAKRFKPTLVLDGKEISHYFPKGAIPANHSRLLLDGPYGETQLALKLPPVGLYTPSCR